MDISQAHTVDGVFLTWLRSLIDDLPLLVEVYRSDGLMVATNRASELFWDVRREEVVDTVRLLEDPQNIALGIPEIFRRVVQGETVRLPPVFFAGHMMADGRSQQVDMWAEVVYFPVRDGQGDVRYVGVLHRDATMQVQQEQHREQVGREIARQREMIVADQEEIARQQEEITSQREMILVLSSLVMPIWEGVLLVPLVGVIDEMRATHVTERLLEAVIRRQSSVVIFDITGLRSLSLEVVSYLIHAFRSCMLVGNRVVVAGMSDAVMAMMTGLGFDYGEVVGVGSLPEAVGQVVQEQGKPVSDCG